jgi:phage baseplate assembly protein W
MPVDASYGLTAPVTPGVSDGVSGQGISILKGPDILGFGLLSPFIREAADFSNAGGIDHLESMIAQVLGTMAGSDYTVGELPWRSDFGSLLHFLRHRQNDDITAELSRVYVEEALAKWIPQIQLVDVRTTRKKDLNGEYSVLELRITYNLINVNQSGNEILGQSVTQTLQYPA